ncbi:hypothetical protein [Bradyrhizobium sp. WSM2254]|uniref:hypothetical protein n=1 Tax=Bradyrhizobium sp. WSM2254 TaxID=1188263 RepID=UPI0009FE274B|nr:hypothetical protein [Bradyrhizobium sp. WSM2254]
MQRRRRFKQVQSLEERLAEIAKRLREEAKSLPPGMERQEKLRKAWQAETGSHVSEWLRSPGLPLPE